MPTRRSAAKTAFAEATSASGAATKVDRPEVSVPEHRRGRLRDKASGLDAGVATLESCSVEQLRLQWRNRLGGLASAHLPRWLLLRLLAYRIQAAALGDLDGSLLRRLRKSRGEGAEGSDGRPFAARPPVTREGVGLQPGALLTREWNGRLERVMVLDEGFAWNGATYRSLSQIAKAMTGTSWNGHRFFGLRRSEDQSGAPATGKGGKGGRPPSKGEGGQGRAKGKPGSLREAAPDET
jgi:Protein of unknown function (DUF2924)